MSWKDKSKVDLIETIRVHNMHKVRVYKDRLAIWRVDGKRLSWEEVQLVKQSVWGDRVAIEVYPAKADVINERHTRHLWYDNRIENLVLKVCTHEEFNNAN